MLALFGAEWRGLKSYISGKRKVLSDPKTHRYYLKLNDEENERFLSMMRQTQYRRAADFIRARLFD